MSALLLALCCLLFSAALPGWAASPRAAAAKLTIYLKTEASQSIRPLHSLKQELSKLMETAGYEVDWRGPEDSHIETRAFLAMVELRGSCEAPSGNLAFESVLSSKADLASTYVSDGQILPFSWVNCDNVTKLLGPTLAGQPGALGDFLYGRAVARLLAHELYHMLLHTSDHTKNGITKSHMSAGDLLLDRLEFEPTALTRLQVLTGHPSDASDPAEITLETSETVPGRNRQFD
jgi:hypothetical protein